MIWLRPCFIFDGDILESIGWPPDCGGAGSDSGKRYVCYVVHEYADGHKKDKNGYFKPIWHYDVKSIAYFTNKEDMKRWMRKQRKAVPYGIPYFYIYLEGENKVYEKYGLDHGLFKLTRTSPLDKRRPQ